MPQTTLAPFQARVAAAIAAYRMGQPVLLQDDEDRENEADIVAAAENLTLATMRLMIRECSGIVCLCLDTATVKALQLAPMASNNQSRYGTNFTVSIEATEGVTTGVSAKDRLTTIRAALASTAQDIKIVSPGHVFPLAAHAEGLRGRQGHTEGSVEIARLAGMRPAAVLCELMNLDGSMARGRQVHNFAKLHGMPVISIQDLRAYVEQQEAVCTES